MPTAPLPPCSMPYCSNRATFRGRCDVHRRTETQRGYGSAWKAARAAVRAEIRACQRCGVTVDLTVDHITPQSLGGTNDRANLRVLCRSCHGMIGVRSASVVMA